MTNDIASSAFILRVQTSLITISFAATGRRDELSRVSDQVLSDREQMFPRVLARAEIPAADGAEDDARERKERQPECRRAWMLERTLGEVKRAADAERSLRSGTARLCL